ncbi:transcriptional repressor LexA [Veillonella caviae]|uniref:transcriptional repressor LexA n=1 Tax=Veillonella caviae TaxID=248316 RepID=UPI000F8E8E63|nr:transcriptional repressor LexA [Veillonella caviae]MCF0158141.1 transcriptional repressor LexA [Veillonella sp.]MCI5708133.1 transcriptional repressor LexA [Veillonella caviae]MCI7693096.1 transcriptional repressor LexA [Veillonella caviae]MDD7291613.1 transcriptional repressor LexA [Veillonella caviae]MDY4746155.1 transcriptional repressor LexA [Veillonella caviae]
MRRPATDINTKQRRILEFIRDSLHNEYRCPTVREICAHVGLSSTSTVQSHLNTLEKFGYIRRDPNKNRAISIVNDIKPNISISKDSNEMSSSDNFEFLGANLKQVPLIGTVQAGMPITAIENLESTMTLPVQLTGNSDCFMLRVQGDSMMNIGIYEGDMLIVRHQNTANNGDVVVARIDDEATVKRFFKEKGHIRLQPENDDFAPIIVKDCHIEGLVIGLVRDKI